MSVQLSEELLAIAEQVCRAAREQGKTPFTVYHGGSDLRAANEPGGTAKEKQIWQT
ncbi:MAG TPA: hypothetical protein VFE06_12780 [Acidobacteriaceae bacterium]|jgi:hypothetical protein|nr:hypothetical protein [Acidobacteriaceae bacterium]